MKSSTLLEEELGESIDFEAISEAFNSGKISADDAIFNGNGDDNGGE